MNTDMREIDRYDTDSDGCIYKSKDGEFFRVSEVESALRSVAPRWVPVGEGLPEKGRVVLVCRVSDVDCSPTKIGWLCETGEWSLFESPYGPVRVTHWMPLPPPPEGCK